MRAAGLVDGVWGPPDWRDDATMSTLPARHLFGRWDGGGWGGGDDWRDDD